MYFPIRYWRPSPLSGFNTCMPKFSTIRAETLFPFTKNWVIILSYFRDHTLDQTYLTCARKLKTKDLELSENFSKPCLQHVIFPYRFLIFSISDDIVFSKVKCFLIFVTLSLSLSFLMRKDLNFCFSSTQILNCSCWVDPLMQFLVPFHASSVFFHWFLLFSRWYEWV